eukprot:GHVR01080733.1.p1 GENE.GHVR01080733.1~~GHVR01080733.1.p1  ORF type:complete len:100 (+),score=14.71 GHVR01080733.1:125-424(+)
MAKKIVNSKLLKSKPITSENKLSAFNNHANKLVAARNKKAEKVDQTKKRLIDNKRSNQMIKISKKATKFSLLEDGAETGMGGMTHKGKKIEDIKEFNDV